MMNFEERKAEVFRRSENRIRSRRRRRSCILGFSIPLCLTLTVWWAGLFPKAPGPATITEASHPDKQDAGITSTAPTCGIETDPMEDLGIGEGATDEVPLLTLETYDEYVEFIESAQLPAGFLAYEDISLLGEFKSFVCLSEARLNDFSSCMYSLIDESQSEFVLYVDIDSQETVPLESTVTAVNNSNMRFLVDSTDTGYYIVSEMKYQYVRGRLLSISWFKGNVRYTLSGDLHTYPENVTATAVAKLLDLQTAESCLDALKWAIIYSQ